MKQVEVMTQAQLLPGVNQLNPCVPFSPNVGQLAANTAVLQPSWSQEQEHITYALASTQGPSSVETPSSHASVLPLEPQMSNLNIPYAHYPPVQQMYIPSDREFGMPPFSLPFPSSLPTAYTYPSTFPASFDFAIPPSQTFVPPSAMPGSHADFSFQSYQQQY